jgi:glutathione synthase/RimK-type ligase-like ATP-grasp enzyme
VIEINDNPNIDAGVEDGFYGDQIYSKIIGALLKRLEDK